MTALLQRCIRCADLWTAPLCTREAIFRPMGCGAVVITRLPVFVRRPTPDGLNKLTQVVEARASTTNSAAIDCFRFCDCDCDCDCKPDGSGVVNRLRGHALLVRTLDFLRSQGIKRKALLVSITGAPKFEFFRVARLTAPILRDSSAPSFFVNFSLPCIT